jgi:predicted Zn-dependent protease
MSDSEDADLVIRFKNGRSTFKEMPARKISEAEIRTICNEHYKSKNESGSSNYKVVVSRSESRNAQQELIKLKLCDKTV